MVHFWCLLPEHVCGQITRVVPFLLSFSFFLSRFSFSPYHRPPTRQLASNFFLESNQIVESIRVLHSDVDNDYSFYEDVENANILTLGHNETTILFLFDYRSHFRQFRLQCLILHIAT